MRWNNEDGAKKNKLLDRTDEIQYGNRGTSDMNKVKDALRQKMK